VAGQVGEARRALARWLDGHPAAGDAALCLSELAANAVLHSASARPGGTFRVLATAQPARLRVEVADDGGTWRPDRGPGDHSGRGLMIVSSLADGWGICATPQARTVWFELSSS
jgi:anti-sigma regulatory factor (Ser/Thr protein kinase)